MRASGAGWPPTALALRCQANGIAIHPEDGRLGVAAPSRPVGRPRRGDGRTWEEDRLRAGARDWGVARGYVRGRPGVGPAEPECRFSRAWDPGFSRAFPPRSLLVRDIRI